MTSFAKYEPTGSEAGTGCLLTIASVPYRAWALATLWNWFIVPFGFVEMTIVPMLGVTIFIRLLTHRLSTTTVITERNQYIERLMEPIWQTTIALITGWAIHRFFM